MIGVVTFRFGGRLPLFLINFFKIVVSDSISMKECEV